MTVCSQEGCGRPFYSRGLCSYHYDEARRHGTLDRHPLMHDDNFVNPLVCVCRSTKADPAVAWGQCPDCKRKPLALMAVAS